MAKKDFAIRKRQMITKARQAMLVIVAIASIFVGICLMISWFLSKKMFFNQRVITAQNETIATLDKNYKNIEIINDKIKVLATNELLSQKKAYPEQTNFQVILDALPDRANTLALGEGLTRSILNVPGVDIEKMSVTKTEAETHSAFSENSSISYGQEFEDVKAPTIHFQLNASGTLMGLNQILKNMENSIRPIFIDKLDFQISSKNTDEQNKSLDEADRRHSLKISARSFYSNNVELVLQKKTLKEDKK